jgi:hypothetical protein
MSKKKNGEEKTHLHLHMPRAQGSLEVVRRTLERLKLNPQKVAGIDAYVVDLDDDLLEGALAQILAPEDRFVFYIDFKEKAPKSARHDVAEFIALANYGIIIGNFELDFEDGAVRFKTSIDFEDAKLTDALVHNMVFAALGGTQAFGAEIINVMRQIKSPVRAIADAEASLRKN